MVKRKRRTSIKTSAGKITTRFYDDGIAKGIEILLDEQVIISFDVYEEHNREGEIRVLVYKKEYAENEEITPIDHISIC